MNIGSTASGGRITGIKVGESGEGDLAKVVLTTPVCTSEGDKVHRAAGGLEQAARRQVATRVALRGEDQLDVTTELFPERAPSKSSGNSEARAWCGVIGCTRTRPLWDTLRTMADHHAAGRAVPAYREALAPHRVGRDREGESRVQ